MRNDQIKPIIHASNENKMTIRIWIPRKDSNDVGHASLQTFSGGPEGHGVYASFWPDQAIKPVPAIFKKVNPLNHSYEQDLITEARPPECIFTFHSFNIERINEAYIQFVRLGCRWSLLSSYYRNLKNNVERMDYNSLNCCGLVLALSFKGEREIARSEEQTRQENIIFSQAVPVQENLLLGMGPVWVGLIAALAISPPVGLFAFGTLVVAGNLNDRRIGTLSPLDLQHYFTAIKRIEDFRYNIIGENNAEQQHNLNSEANNSNTINNKTL